MLFYCVFCWSVCATPIYPVCSLYAEKSKTNLRGNEQQNKSNMGNTHLNKLTDKCTRICSPSASFSLTLSCHYYRPLSAFNFRVFLLWVIRTCIHACSEIDHQSILAIWFIRSIFVCFVVHSLSLSLSLILSLLFYYFINENKGRISEWILN